MKWKNTPSIPDEVPAMNQSQLTDRLPDLLGDALISQSLNLGEVTCEIDPARIADACAKLRDDADLRFETLIDLCGMDYAHWGTDDSAQGGSGSPGGPDAVTASAWARKSFRRGLSPAVDTK